MTYSQLRAQARAALKDRWAMAIAVAMVAALLGGLLAGSSFLPDIDLNGEAANWNQITVYEGLTFTIAPLGIISFFLGGVIQLGYAHILLVQHAGQDYEFRDLFSQFHRYGQGFAQSFLRNLYVALWSLLLIIPGIIASYRYAMTPYIMADHPEMSASDAIAASCELMDGHKGELFTLHLTFIGWDLLAALTMNIGHLVLNPYKNATEAAFYREIAGYPRITVE